jgi:predicted nucleic acid-binding protein
VVKALFDSNIIIDHLNGREQALAEIERYEAKAISLITWMEVLAGTSEERTDFAKAFLSNFEIIPIDGQVAARSVEIRRTRKVKLPDAIIRASASVHSLLLVTRDVKDFEHDDPGIRVPYRL